MDTSIKNPQEAARGLSARMIKKGFEFQALHEYCNMEGKAIYWRIRLKHPTTGEKWLRPMHLNAAGEFVLGEPEFKTGKPLYRLPDIVRDLDKIVWVTEGEWCADTLTKLGLIVTTSGSADSASKTDWIPLANRHVIIWRDFDEAGLRYAKAVTFLLQQFNCTVQWIDVAQLNLADKDDCVDWLKAHTDATAKEVESLPILDATLLVEIMDTSSKIKKPTATNANLYSFTVNDKGVFYTDENDIRWICSSLQIKALVRDKLSENWGRLLELSDADGNLHTWAMPMEMLKGSGEELRGELLRLGLEIAPGAKTRNLLIEYITTAKPEARARCVTRTGWYNQVFVFPDRTIGAKNELVIYQSENSVRAYAQAGTLQEWQQQVSKLCVGNSRLVLAISCAFAAMLLHPTDMESGGIHLVGASSSGKTTALRVAASVFGSPQYVNRWRATTNGLEALAALHSDTLLVLDELAQVDPHVAGEIAYMLANGSGKTRANRAGTAKTRYEWHLLFLSAGEVSLSQHMREVGKKARAGQEVRLVDIPADAGQGLGIFETLHLASTSAELSQALLKATNQYYGTAAIAFLTAATQKDNFLNLPQLTKQLHDAFLANNLPTNACGQVHRVCERFALIAAAGEFATYHGITGWQPHEAEQAAVTCFKAWLEQRGSINDQERTNVLSQVRGFLEAHGESRFTEWDAKLSHTANRAGLKKTSAQGTQFYVLAEAFHKEVCSGLDSRSAAHILLTENWLLPGDDGKPYRREYLPNIGRSRCYVFTQKVWED